MLGWIWRARKRRARWRAVYLRITENPHILRHWHEQEESLLFRLLQAVFLDEDVRIELPEIWPFGKDYERPHDSHDLDAAYLAAGLVLDRLFGSWKLVPDQMREEIVGLWRFAAKPNAKDVRVLALFGPYEDGRPMTDDTVEELWKLIEKDIQAWPENREREQSRSEVEEAEKKQRVEAEKAMFQADSCTTVNPYENWHEWAFEALEPHNFQLFDIGTEKVTDRELMEAFTEPKARARANAAAMRVLRAAAEYDRDAAQRFAFPLLWLQEYRTTPSFLDKLAQPSAGFAAFDDDDADWMDFREFEIAVWPKLRPLDGKNKATFMDGSENWGAERKDYVMEHPYGYIYLERVGPSSRDRDIHLFLLAILHDGAVGANKVLMSEVLATHIPFYRALVGYCADLSSQVPQRFRGFLAELDNELQMTITKADGDPEAGTVKGTPPKEPDQEKNSAPTAHNVTLPPSRMLAGQAMCFALLRERSLITSSLGDIYQWIQDHHDNEANPYHGKALPSKDNWKKYLRIAFDQARIRELTKKEWAFADSKGHSVVDISQIDYGQIHRIEPQSD